MRIAVFSDIHGNCLALDTVLADIAKRDIDRGVCLGDAIQGGAQPAQAVARLRALDCPIVMGNADAFMLSGESAGAEPTTTLMNRVREWSLSQLSDEDRAFIGSFVPTVEIALEGGHRLLCFHGTPGSFDEVIFPHTPEEEVRGYLGAHIPAIMCGGHTHLQQIRRLDDTFFFNPGSVGFSYSHTQERGPGFRADPWAEYAILTSEGASLSLELRKVPLDLAALREAIQASGHVDTEGQLARYRPRD
jgi:predicted phosphodiesterase